jgi:arabinofuranosyltransferase
MPVEAPATGSTRDAHLRRALLLLTVGALVGLAWTRRFVQDDAFISFRYAQHLARGQGLTWNVGEPPIQGFTNLLWTLAIAVAMHFGVDPVAAAYAMGLVAFAGTLAGTHAVVRALGGSRTAAWVGVVLVGANFTVSAYATGGLETQVQACLLTWAAYLSVHLVHEPDADGAHTRAIALSVLGGAALWLRLDSALPMGILLVAPLLRREATQRLRVALVAPVTLALVALVAFDLHTFGTVVPNTYYAKADRISASIVKGGAEYVLAFLRHYGLLPYLAFAAVMLPRATRGDRAILLPVACVVSWAAYVVWVGGDFMEFRILVPVLPMAFALLTVLLFAFVAIRPLRAALIVTVVLESAAHQYETYDEMSLQDGNTIETIHGLAAHLDAPDQAWSEIGRALHRAFGGDARVTISVGAAGAMPYYSELRTIDLFGLNDAWVARHGLITGPRAGHRRAAPVGYLLQQGVNLAIIDLDAGLPGDASVVHIPITPEYTADFVYLVHSPVVDEAVRREGWAVTPVR